MSCVSDGTNRVGGVSVRGEVVQGAVGGSSGGDSFGGAWLVTEYVYDPDGTYRGTIAQRRELKQVTRGCLRVTQRCEPSAALAGHPMAAFAGEWVFDLEVDGVRRRYLGPDVVGTGTEWQRGAMTAQGIWPRFGYEFESYSVLVAADRQLTGGFFSLAGRSVADIIGVAVPESSQVKPQLDLSAPPPDLNNEHKSHIDVGTTGRADHNGLLPDVGNSHRAWSSDTDKFSEHNPYLPEVGNSSMLRRTVGPMLVAVAWPAPSQRQRWWAIQDPLSATSVVLAENVVNGQRSVSVTIT